MARINLTKMSVFELVKKFTEIGLAQGEADLDGNRRKYNKLYTQMEAVENELKSRAGDGRTALIPLYDHPNVEVRLKAAKATLAVAPDKARQVLITIRDSKLYQALEAGMTLYNLDEGVFKPT